MTVLGSGGRLEPQSGVPDSLTRIHRRIHCAATPGTNEHETVFDRIATDNLLDTLVEIALAIARRREQIDP